MRHVPGIQPRWEPPLAAPWAPGGATGRDGGAYPYDVTWMMNRASLAECLAGRWAVSPDVQGGSWRWAADSGGSTASSETGPSPTARHAYCYIETSGGGGNPAAQSQIGRLTMQDSPAAEGATWGGAARDRTLTLRCCLQGHFGQPIDGDAEGLAVEWAAMGIPSWERAHLVRGWAYEEDRLAGDEIADYGGETFTVAEDGGWRDVTVAIPDAARHVRLRPIYAPESGGSQSYRQDVALRWARLRGTVSDPALATSPRPAPIVRTMTGDRAADLAAWEHTPWSNLNTGGGWIGRPSAGTTPTSQTGPAPSNALPYVHTDVGNADLDPQAERGILTLLTGPGDPGRAWAQAERDRYVSLELCMQGHWGHTGEGLYVEGRASDAGAWADMARRIHGWPYAAPAAAGEVANDYASLPFRRIADGGWRGVSVDVLPGVRQLRLRPSYVGAPRERHDIAIARIELGYLA